MQVLSGPEAGSTFDRFKFLFMVTLTSIGRSPAVTPFPFDTVAILKVLRTEAGSSDFFFHKDLVATEVSQSLYFVKH